MAKKIRTLIRAEDVHTRNHLLSLLAAEGDVEVISHGDEVRGARGALDRYQADVLFLEATGAGLEALRQLRLMEHGQAPLLIVIAASSRHALAAFDARALDYLLKPIQPGRLHRSLQRVRDCLAAGSSRSLSPRQMHLLEDIESAPQHLTRLTVRQNDRVFFVRVDDISWVEAADNYVILHVGKQTYMLRERLSALEAALDPDQFFRISRSALVNTAHLSELRPLFRGEHVVVLHDGSRLPMTREVHELEAMLKFSCRV